MQNVQGTTGVRRHDYELSMTESLIEERAVKSLLCCTLLLMTSHVVLAQDAVVRTVGHRAKHRCQRCREGARRVGEVRDLF